MSRVRVWLVISLVANVFLLGAVGGGLYSWNARQQAMAQRGLRFAASELPQARQDQFTAALQDLRHDPVRRQLARAPREGRLELTERLTAPPLDAAALDAALARTRDAEIALRAQTESLVAQFAATLTPDERLKLVDGMERHGVLRMTVKRPVRSP